MLIAAGLSHHSDEDTLNGVGSTQARLPFIRKRFALSDIADIRICDIQIHPAVFLSRFVTGKSECIV